MFTSDLLALNTHTHTQRRRTRSALTTMQAGPLSSASAQWEEPKSISRARERWNRAVRIVRDELAYGETPSFALDKLHDFERLFFRDGKEISLTLEEFQEAFGEVLRGKHNRQQWRRLFADIDADRGGTVSWDEFTTFMIHHSVCSVGEYHRSKEFVPHVVSTKLNHCHKDVASHILTCPKTKQLLTAGDDGCVRVWDPDMSFVQSINNSRNSASSKLSSHGVLAYPICDMTLGGSGSVCAVSSIDKCINLYLTEGMTLFRRYIGRNLLNDVNIPAILEPGISRPVDTVILMGMQDAISTCDMGALSNGRENFFIGHMDGSMSIYPTMRHSLISDVRPTSMFKVHGAAIHKLRFEPMEGIISAGWDKLVLYTDPETGQASATFNTPGCNGHLKYVTHFSYNRDLRLLATIAGEKDACLWTSQMSTPAAKLQGHVVPLIGLTANDNEHQLMTMSQDMMIKVWDMRTFKHFQTLVYTSATLKPTAIHYDSVNEQLVGLAGVPSSWRPRRALTAFPPSYKGHIEPVVSMCYNRELDTLVTTDLCTSMSWGLRTGARTIAWETVKENQQAAAACLDYSGRRLFVVTKSGVMFVFNHRSGQLIREESIEAHDPVQVLSLCHPPNFIFIVVVCFSQVIILQEDGSDFVKTVVHCGKARFTSAAAGPLDNMGIPIALCGTTTGSVIAVCVEIGCVMYELTSSGIYSAKVRDPMQEYVSSRHIQKQVECLVMLPLKNLVVISTGEKYLHVFALGQKPVYGGVVAVPLAALSTACNSSETILAIGDELGNISVCDISELERKTRDFKLDSTCIVVKHTFKLHKTTIQRLVCIPHKSLLVSVAADSSIVVCTFEGTKIGTLGLDMWSPPPNSPLVLPPRRRSVSASHQQPSEQQHVSIVSVGSTPKTHRSQPPRERDLPVELNPSAFFMTSCIAELSMCTASPENQNDRFQRVHNSDDDTHSGDDNSDHPIHRFLNSRESWQGGVGRTRSQRFVTDGRSALTPTVGHRTRSVILKVPETELARMRSTPTAGKGRRPLPIAKATKVDDAVQVTVTNETEEDLERRIAELQNAEAVLSPTLRAISPQKYRLPSRGAITPDPYVPSSMSSPSQRSNLSMMMATSLLGTKARDAERMFEGTARPAWSPTTTDTGKKVRAAKLINPRGWTSSISSYLPVVTVPTEVLDAPVASSKFSKFARRKTLAPL